MIVYWKVEEGVEVRIVLPEVVFGLNVLKG
jgi:hypothetical protein